MSLSTADCDANDVPSLTNLLTESTANTPAALVPASTAESQSGHDGAKPFTHIRTISDDGKTTEESCSSHAASTILYATSSPNRLVEYPDAPSERVISDGSDTAVHDSFQSSHNDAEHLKKNADQSIVSAVGDPNTGVSIQHEIQNRSDSSLHDCGLESDLGDSTINKDASHREQDAPLDQGKSTVDPLHTETGKVFIVPKELDASVASIEDKRRGIGDLAVLSLNQVEKGALQNTTSVSLFTKETENQGSVVDYGTAEPTTSNSIDSHAKLSSDLSAPARQLLSNDNEKSDMAASRMVDESSVACKYDAYIDGPMSAENWEAPLTEGFARARGDSRSDAGSHQINLSEEIEGEGGHFKRSNAPPTALVAGGSSGVVSEITTPSLDLTTVSKPDPPGLQESSLLPEPALVRARANLVRTTPGAFSMAGPGTHLATPDLVDDQSNHNDDEDESTPETNGQNSFSPGSLQRSHGRFDHTNSSTFQTTSGLDPTGTISAEVEAELVDETQRDLELLRLQEINQRLQRQLEAIGAGNVSFAHAEIIAMAPVIDGNLIETTPDSEAPDPSSQEQGVLDKFFLSSSRAFWLLAGLLFLAAVTTGGLVAARRADSNVRLDLVSPSSLPTQFPTSGSPGPTTILLRSPAPTEQPSWREGPTSLTPSFEPSVFVTVDPTLDITSSLFPSLRPSDSVLQSSLPSIISSVDSAPTEQPFISLTMVPTGQPVAPPFVTISSNQPTQEAVLPPITQPVAAPTSRPTQRPVAAPVPSPVPPPTPRPTQRPVVPPVSPPVAPTQRPTARPTPRPTARPTLAPVTLSPTAPKKCFDSTSELRVAVSLYVELPYSFTETSRTYGFPIGTWCVGNIRDFSAVFQDKVNFNEDISSWDTRRATNMKDMFGQATSFNIDLNNWDVSNVQNMEGMFFGATSFSRGVSRWNVSRVTNMLGMFNLAISFNDNLSSWDVSQVQNMGRMFNGATLFNQNLSNWDVSSVTNAALMFYAATSFHQNLCQWGPKLVSNRPSVQNMFVLSRCPMKSSPDFNAVPISPLCTAC